MLHSEITDFYLLQPLSPRVNLPRYVVGVVFGFEHLLLVLALWLRWAIHPVPKKVRLAIARRKYLAEHRESEHGDTDKNKRD